MLGRSVDWLVSPRMKNAGPSYLERKSVGRRAVWVSESRFRIWACRIWAPVVDCEVRRGRELRKVELGLKGGYCSVITVSFFVTLGEAVEWGFGGVVGMGAWVGGREEGRKEGCEDD